RRHDTVHRGFLDEQRLAAAGFLHFAVGQFGEFEFGGDRLRDAGEFAGAVELSNELAEGIKCHEQEYEGLTPRATTRRGPKRNILASISRNMRENSTRLGLDWTFFPTKT